MTIDSLKITNGHAWANVAAMVIVVFAMSYIFHHTIYLKSQYSVAE